MIQKTIKQIFSTTIFTLIIGLSLASIPFLLSLQNQEVLREFNATITSWGIWGYIAVFALQVVQVVVAFIPGEPIEVLVGIFYNTVGGFLICLVGIIIGTSIIFKLVQTFGNAFSSKFIDTEKFQNIWFLQSSKNIELLTFILFFIPGTPKDLLTYFFPLTKLKLLPFLLLSCTARIPSILSTIKLHSKNPINTFF